MKQKDAGILVFFLNILVRMFQVSIRREDCLKV